MKTILRQNKAILLALAAAALFGASAPLAKLLLAEIHPLPLAALLYSGSGVGLLLCRFARRAAGHGLKAEAKISKADMPWLLGATISGGIAAPVVLLFSLRITPAATASLVLNFEGVATVLIAFFVFREAIGRRVWLAVAIVTLGVILLSVDFSGKWGFSIGAGQQSYQEHLRQGSDPYRRRKRHGGRRLEPGLGLQRRDAFPWPGPGAFGLRPRFFLLWPEYCLLHIFPAGIGRGSHQHLFFRCALHRRRAFFPDFPRNTAHAFYRCSAFHGPWRLFAAQRKTLAPAPAP